MSLKLILFDKNNFMNVNIGKNRKLPKFSIFFTNTFFNLQAVKKKCVRYAHLPVLLGLRESKKKIVNLI